MKRTHHRLKTWPVFFKESQEGRKLWEHRVNDRNFRVGDLVTLAEYEPELKRYTGQEICGVITYIYHLHSVHADKKARLSTYDSVIFTYERTDLDE